MNLVIENNANGTLARVEGRLDTINAPEFEKLMQPLLVGDAPVIELNCADLEYIASSGLRLFLTLQKSVVSRKGQLTLTNLRPDIKTVFDMTRFSTIFKIV